MVTNFLRENLSLYPIWLILMLKPMAMCSCEPYLVAYYQARKSKTKLSINIRSWNSVATWKWIANDDTCGICRVAFDGCCPDCKLPGDDCPLVWGACTHCFHIHCIMKWLNRQAYLCSKLFKELIFGWYGENKHRCISS